MSLVFTPARGDNHSPVIYMKAHANHNIFDVSLETFDTLVLAASGNRPVLVDFWAEWCSPCIALEAVLHRVIEEFAGKIGLARIEAHYFKNSIFLPANALLEGVGRIRHIPAAIVQGRYDVVCPIATADALHRRWPEADYAVVPDAGHSAMEPGIRRALVAATEAFKRLE